jgi:hypothetical protein
MCTHTRKVFAMGKKPQVNFQLEYDEKDLLDRVAKASGHDPSDIARALIRQLIRAYEKTGRVPAFLDLIVPETTGSGSPIPEVDLPPRTKIKHQSGTTAAAPKAVRGLG